MSERGFFALDRGWFDHPFFPPEPYTQREAWAWLIAEAAWRPRSRRIGSVAVDLQRGQLAASVRFMAEKWKWTPARVQRFLERLKTDTMIITASDTGLSVITICNYDKYQVLQQGTDTASDTEIDTAAIQQRYKREPLNHLTNVHTKEISSLRSEVARAEGDDLLVAPPVKKERQTRGNTHWPSGFHLTADLREYAQSKGVRQIPEVWEAFENHHRAKGSRFRDWAAAWRKWVGNEVKFAPQERAGFVGRMNGAGGAPAQRLPSKQESALAGIFDFAGEQHDDKTR